MSEFLAAAITALGLVLVLEGLAYGAAPAAMKRMLQTLLDAPDDVVRIAGVLCAAAGVFLVWLARG